MFELTISTLSVLLLLLLSVYLVLKKKSVNGTLFALFLFLLGSIQISEQLSLFLQDDFIFYKKISLLLESLLPAVVIFFSFFYARQYSLKSMSSSRWLWMAGTMIFPLIVYIFKFNELFFRYIIQEQKVLLLSHVGYWFYLGIMVYCVASLVNIEKTFVSSKGIERWRIKLEALGIIAVISILIFYYSQAVLHTKIKMSLMPLRSIIFICAALLIGYSNYARGNNVQISVSRQVLYRSTVMLLVVFYLLFLGLIVKGMRYFGVDINRDLIPLIAFLSGITLFLLLFSEKIRRKAKVIINKNFYAHKYDYRREWLRFTEKLSICKNIEDVKEIVLTSYMETFGLKGVSLYLYERKKNKYILALQQYMEDIDTEFMLSQSMESYFLKNQRVLNPNDGECIPDKAEQLLIQQSGATMIVPLIINDRIIGIVVLGKQLQREQYMYEDYDLMKNLSRQAALALQNHIISDELSEMREFAAVGNVRSFVIHDLKNTASSLSLLMNNADVYVGDPTFQKDMIGTLRNSVNRMKGLIQKLNDIPSKFGLDTEAVDLDLLVRESADEFKRMQPAINISIRGQQAYSVVAVEEIKKIIVNLLLNAREATGDHGNIIIETGTSNGKVYCRIEDNGCGISREFYQNHLFKPFRTTKKNGLGIGLYQSKQIIEAHGGVIEAHSEPGKGAVFTFYLQAAVESKCIND